MTPERIAELRPLAESFSGLQFVVTRSSLQWPWTSVTATNQVVDLVRAIPDLLDALAAATRELERQAAELAENDGWQESYNALVKVRHTQVDDALALMQKVGEERDEARAQLVAERATREAAEEDRDALAAELKGEREEWAEQLENSQREWRKEIAARDEAVNATREARAQLAASAERERLLSEVALRVLATEEDWMHHCCGMSDEGHTEDCQSQLLRSLAAGASSGGMEDGS